MKLSIVFTWMKNSDNFDLITNVSFAYLFHKRGGSSKVYRAHFSTSSIVRFTTRPTDETGEPITVPKTCLQCFPRKQKFIELKQISSPLIRSVVDKFAFGIGL